LVLFIYAKKLYNSTNTQFLENFERGFTMGYTVAVVGATGAVGAQMIKMSTEDAFEGVDIALFSAGGSTSAKYAPYAVKAGAVVVDNTSYFRQNPDVPLVVPEVNAHALDAHNGIISCPNCSTIQMMVALEPVRQKWGLDRIIGYGSYS